MVAKDVFGRKGERRKKEEARWAGRTGRAGPVKEEERGVAAYAEENSRERVGPGRGGLHREKEAACSGKWRKRRGGKEKI